MNRLVEFVGTIAIIGICLYFGIALFNAGLEFTSDLWWWARRKFFPGLGSAVVIGGVIWVGWGLVSRNGRVG